MFDSLPYRNDAAIIFRRLARSLPLRAGVLGIATCDKGLPAMLMAVAGLRDLPSVVVPGGVTLPPTTGEDAGHGANPRRAFRARTGFAVGSSGTGLSRVRLARWRLPIPRHGGDVSSGRAKRSDFPCRIRRSHLPGNPSGWTWPDVRPARCICLGERKLTMRDVLTPASLRNAMVLHAAFGGSTNLLLHIPAIAHAAGLKPPTVEDWISVNRRVPRLVSVLPNGPIHHPTVRVFLAGGVPEVMLHLRRLGPARHQRADGHRPDPGRKSGLVGEVRTPHALPRIAAAAGRRECR